MPALRSPHDREILRLALPALGTLAAEPTYLLVDTAIVGHLGTAPLAALALAAAVLGVAVGVCVFLSTATTAITARVHGAGEDDVAARLASQALWIGLAAGLLVAVAVAAAAGPLVRLTGGSGVAGATREDAVAYLRIAALGVPSALLAFTAQGWLRGTADLRRPLLVVVVGNALNLVLDVLLVYGLGYGLLATAVSTALAQTIMGGWFAAILWRAGRPAPRRPVRRLLRPMTTVGGLLFVRTAALLGTFTLATSVAARLGEAPVAAHQIAFQLFLALALLFDAIAVAGQVIVGRGLGAGDVPTAVGAARRMLWWAGLIGTVVALALLAARGPVVGAFTPDAAVRTQAAALWPLFCLLIPAAALVFALDGILLGAGDAGYLAGAMLAAGAVATPLLLLVPASGLGVAGVWAALCVLIGVRLAGVGGRVRGERWARPGAWRA